ncbi:MAG TPA: 3-hydroxybutyryl-CoA dehydrogenase [Gemmatimonadales bacterium]|nr:3-hydroxybutyryl-CoA dehydrogenase [Gemmatimonadales bacterium]
MSNIQTVGVLGCGLMGSGIAQVAAMAGCRVVVRDTAPEQLEKGRLAIGKSLAKLVEKGKLAATAQEAALNRLRFVTDLGGLTESDLIIEAVTEDLALKNQLWRELDASCPARTVFASNTSSLTIASMAAATTRPDRFAGLHFFNPVPLLPLVEVVRSVLTSSDTVDLLLAFARKLGKEPVLARDSSGFIVNLLLVPYMLDAIRALERGVASISDIDSAMRLGASHPMGPLTLADFVGLDTLARIGDIMFEEYRETRYAPPPLLRRMVLAGLFGRKNGRGFYDYSQDPAVPSDLGL